MYKNVGEKSRCSKYRYRRYAIRGKSLHLDSCADNGESIGHASPAAAERLHGNVDDFDKISTLIAINNSAHTAHLIVALLHLTAAIF